MNIEQAIFRLYESEINCGMGSFWDGGVTAWIGDEFNGRKVEQNFDPENINKIGAWMISEAKKIYPLAFSDDLLIKYEDQQKNTQGDTLIDKISSIIENKLEIRRVNDGDGRYDTWIENSIEVAEIIVSILPQIPQ